MSHPRDERAEVLAVDRYLDGLLAAADASATPGSDATSGVDPMLTAAASRLRRDLVRIHPSFRFEERLASRLAAAAAGRSLAAGAEGLVVPFRRRPPVQGVADDGAEDALLAAISAGTVDPAAAPRQAPASMPVILGSALTSAALSIAGVAWIAWRASQRAGATPMGRAARAAHRRASRTRGRAMPVSSTARRPGLS